MVLETKEKNYSDFNKLQMLFMWLTAWTTTCLICCYQPFIKLWVGEEMMFSDNIMMIFCIYFLTLGFNRVCYIYRQVAGLWWQDRFRPIAEIIANFILNIVLVKYIGVTGVMFSTIFCIVFIDCVWGGRTLFKYYFTDRRLSEYLLKLALYTIFTVISCAICYYICTYLSLDGVTAIIVNLIIASVISNAIFALGCSFLPEFKPAMRFA